MATRTDDGITVEPDSYEDDLVEISFVDLHNSRGRPLAPEDDDGRRPGQGRWVDPMAKPEADTPPAGPSVADQIGQALGVDGEPGADPFVVAPPVTSSAHAIAAQLGGDRATADRLRAESAAREAAPSAVAQAIATSLSPDLRAQLEEVTEADIEAERKRAQRKADRDFWSKRWDQGEPIRKARAEAKAKAEAEAAAAEAEAKAAAEAADTKAADEAAEEAAKAQRLEADALALAHKILTQTASN